MKEGEILITPQGNEYEIVSTDRISIEINVDGIEVWLDNEDIEKAGWKVKQVLKDLDIVYAWDDGDVNCIAIGIYNVEQNSIYNHNGCVFDPYNHYELVPLDHIPQMILDAKKKMEDER